MYGYENDTLYPVSEGAIDTIKEWGKKVLDFIREQGKKIRMWMHNVAVSIKNFFKKDEDKSYQLGAFKDTPKLVTDIGKGVTDLIESCVANINDLENVYEFTTRIGHYRTEAKAKGVNNLNNYDIGLNATKAGLRNSGNKYYTPMGMSDLHIIKNKLNAKDVQRWNEYVKFAEVQFKKNSEAANDMRSKLNELKKTNLTHDMLKAGYDALKNIFSANSKFGMDWNNIVVARDWAVGKIRKYLGDVVRMYHVGISVTNSLVSKLNTANRKSGDIGYQPIKKEKATTAHDIRKDFNKNPNKYVDYDTNVYRWRAGFTKSRFANEDVDNLTEYNDEMSFMFTDAFDSGYFQALEDYGYLM